MNQSTSNSRVAAVTLADIERIRDSLLSNPPPLTEMRMHPLDVEQLRSRFGLAQISPHALTTIRIVEDDEAPLLPRTEVAFSIFSR